MKKRKTNKKQNQRLTVPPLLSLSMRGTQVEDQVKVLVDVATPVAPNSLQTLFFLVLEHENCDVPLRRWHH
jgi:hypothetical protein